jgi:hypothetical protein
MAKRAVTQSSLNRAARKGLRIDGAEAIQERISDILDAVTGPEVKRVFMKGALVLRDEARDIAPYNEDREKLLSKGKITEQRHLRDAIFAAYGDKGKPNVLVGVNPKIAPHFHWLEYGIPARSTFRAQPYMRPAITATQRTVSTIIIEGLQKVVEQAARK